MAGEEEDQELEDDDGGAPSAEPPDGGPRRPDTPGSDDDPEDPRRVAHELVGLAHAVLSIAGREDVLPHWCPDDLQPSVRESAAEVALAIGRMHAAIATGEHDTDLRAAAGIGGPVGRPKRKWFRRTVERLTRVVRAAGPAAERASEALRGQRAVAIRSWLKAGAGWGKLVIDSVASEIPGGDLIKEALETIVVGVDTMEAEAATNPNDPGGSP